MNSVQSLLFLFTVFSYGAAETCKEVCVLDDRECVTKGGYLTFTNVVKGVKDLIAPSDPLKIDQVDVNIGSLKYELTHITFTGLKNCVVTKFTLNVNTTQYKQYLHCPKLISTFHFGGKKDQDIFGFNKKGLARITAYNYNILNEGLYGVFVKEDDHMPHIFVKVETLQTKTEVKGKLVFEIKGDCTEEEYKETEDLNNNSWKTEKYLHYPIVERAMEILTAAIDLYCREFHMGEVIPHGKKSNN